MNVTDFLALVREPKKHEGYWLAKCPAHDDRKRSLSVGEGREGVLLKCHAGCSVDAICAALSLEASELFYEKRERGGEKFSAIYSYSDPHGKVLFQVCRTPDKQFPQRHPDGKGGWIWGMKGVAPVLYNLPLVIDAAQHGGPIFLVEGEKDADNLIRLGLVATTSPMGAGKWRREYAESLRGGDVILIPDNDDAGRPHMENAAASLLGVAHRVRILDLPNLPKKGDVSDWLAMGGTREDLLRLVESAPEIEKAWSETDQIEIEVGSRKFVFGRDCRVEAEKKVDGEILPVKIPFAREVWPREKYEQVEDGEFGVRYLFRDHAGQLRHAVLPHGASVDSAQASRASALAANSGVQVAPESKGLLALALGHWGRSAHRHISLVKTPGWHRGGAVYVNGGRIFGARSWKADESAPSIEARSGRSGSVEEWKKSADLFVSPGILAAVGLSLAGPLVGLLGAVPFGLHFCGDSSHGKTTAARLASAVWGAPSRMFQTWNAGRRALEGLADPANGACLILDEIKNFGGKPEHLSEAIHSLCSQQGRARMAPDGKLLQQRRWENTILSTGEVRTRDLLGSHFQGGHRVRMIDVWVGAGDLTRSREHAARIDALAYENFGVLGDAWIEKLIEVGADRIREKVAEFAAGSGSETNEEQRVRGNLALVATALHFASEWRLLPIDLFDVEKAKDWLVETTRDGTTEPSSPNERAWALLQQLSDAQPYRFPFSTNHTTGRDVIAYKVLTDCDPIRYELWTTESMLRASGLDVSAGVQVRRWLDWLVAQGRATDLGRFYLEGMRRRWVKILLNESVQKDEVVGTELGNGTDLFGEVSR